MAPKPLLALLVLHHYDRVLEVLVARNPRMRQVREEALDHCYGWAR